MVPFSHTIETCFCSSSDATYLGPMYFLQGLFFDKLPQCQRGHLLSCAKTTLKQCIKSCWILSARHHKLLYYSDFSNTQSEREIYFRHYMIDTSCSIGKVFLLCCTDAKGGKHIAKESEFFPESLFKFLRCLSLSAQTHFRFPQSSSVMTSRNIYVIDRCRKCLSAI